MGESDTDRIVRDFSQGFSFGNLESLLLFAEHPSVTAAAGKKGRVANSVTRHLNALEQFFGCTLRQKDGKRKIITTEGEDLVALLRRHLLELQNFRDTHTKNLNSVSLAAGDSLLHVVVLPNLHLLQGPFIKTVLSVSAARTFQIIEGLEDLTLDLGLLNEEPLKQKGKQKRKKSLAYEAIGNYRYAVFVPKQLWKPELGQSGVFSLPMAMIKHHWDTNFLQLAAENGVKFSEVRVLCENFIQVFHLVRLGHYAGVLPLFCHNMLKDYAHPVAHAFLADQERKVVLAWNPQLLTIKEQLKPYIPAIVPGLRNIFNHLAVLEPQKDPTMERGQWPSNIDKKPKRPFGYYKR